MYNYFAHFVLIQENILVKWKFAFRMAILCVEILEIISGEKIKVRWPKCSCDFLKTTVLKSLTELAAIFSSTTNITLERKNPEQLLHQNVILLGIVTR